MKWHKNTLTVICVPAAMFFAHGFIVCKNTTYAWNWVMIPPAMAVIGALLGVFVALLASLLGSWRSKRREQARPF